MYRRSGYGPRSFERGASTPAPVKVGDTPTVKIEGRGKSGDGIARVQGFVIFVSGANVGDEVKVRIKDVRPRYATAEVVKE
jgi:predicted RNA-binding protein with TRAM domain